MCMFQNNLFQNKIRHSIFVIVVWKKKNESTKKIKGTYENVRGAWLSKYHDFSTLVVRINNLSDTSTLKTNNILHE